jgi:predicted kinase
MATLIVFGGLPGAGKTAIARELATRIGAVYLRIDTIEQTLRDSGAISNLLNDAGYGVAYALAEDNLRLGNTVVADSVNPVQFTRDAWIAVAERAKARAIEVEVICSDADQHRQRVESRISDISGLKLPTWSEVISREYEPWQRNHILIDSATHATTENVEKLFGFLKNEVE